MSNVAQESNLVTHARRELELCGQTAEDPEFSESLIAAVRGFASYGGHSGGSAMAGIDMLTRLLRFEALAPLTDDPAEWIDRSEMSGTPLWQNVRDSAVFSEDGGKTWKLTDPTEGGLVELRIPCSTTVLPMLRAGLPTRSIRLEENGDGTHQLIVIGAQGALSDPFVNVTGLEDEHARYRAALERIVRRAEEPCGAHEAPLPYDVAWAEQVAIAREAL